jgi:hypothetical protein
MGSPSSSSVSPYANLDPSSITSASLLYSRTIDGSASNIGDSASDIEAELLRKRIREVLTLPGNDICVDCGGKGTGHLLLFLLLLLPPPLPLASLLLLLFLNLFSVPLLIF